MKALTTRMQMAMERAWTDSEGVVRVDNSTLMQTIRGLQARGLVAPYSHVLTADGLKWRNAVIAAPSGAVVKSVSATGRVAAVAIPGDWRMLTVDYNEICGECGHAEAVHYADVSCDNGGPCRCTGFKAALA